MSGKKAYTGSDSQLQPLADAEAVHGSSPVKTIFSTLRGSMPIYMGPGAVTALPELLRGLAPDRVFIVSDATVLGLHGAALLSQIPRILEPKVFEAPEGDGEKNLENLGALCRRFFDGGITKSSLVLNFGGGMVLNLGGLAAGLTYRGIRFLQIPTSLMAQSDVIVSNKQGINFAGGKNRLGMFASPSAAVADTDFLKTEPQRQTLAAMVEYAKNALLLGGEHYAEAMIYLSGDERFHHAQLAELLRRCLAQKLHIGRLDPDERGLGLMLEYGHTVGHALETLSRGRLLHGEAVFHGLRIAGLLASKLGIMRPEEAGKQAMLLDRIGPVTPIPGDITPDEIMDCVRRDNKKIGKEISFVLLRAVGEPHGIDSSILTSVPESVLREILSEYIVLFCGISC